MKKIKNKWLIVIALCFFMIDGIVVFADDTSSYEDLLSHRSGFSKNVTGGQGGQVITVTNLNNSGEGSLREALAIDGPTWIRFDGLNGVINLNSDLYIKSDTTIDGRNANVTISNYTTIIHEASNIIIHNIKINNVYSSNKGDGLNISRYGHTTGESKNIWIDHLSISNCDDELFDIQANDGSAKIDDMTLSYNEFFADDSNSKNDYKGGLIMARSDTKVTFHHNYYHHNHDRHPNVQLGAKVHYFNNYIYDINPSGWSGDGVHSRTGSEVSSEGNIFEPNNNNTHYALTQTGSETQGYLRSIGDKHIKNGTWTNMSKANNGPGFYLATSNTEGKVFNPESYYDYTVESADDNLRQKIKNCAGWQNNPYSNSCIDNSSQPSPTSTPQPSITSSPSPTPTPQPTITSQPSPTNEPPKKYNLTNFIKLANNWLKKITNNQELTKEIDLNNDGIINSRDIGIMMSNWE